MRPNDTATGTTARPQAHKPNGSDLATERCPWCGSAISRGEFERIVQKISEQERARLAKAEQTLREQFTREQQQAQTKAKAEVAKAVRDATAVITRRLELLRANQEATVAAKVGAEREKTAKAVADAVAAEREKNAVERVRLESALAALGKKVAALPAHQIGAPAEKSLYDTIAALLAETAPLDRVSRVGPGVRGADLIVEVIADNGETAGKIIIESEATTRFMSGYTRVLRDNQIREGAAFGILSTATMPPNCREVAVVDNTIVCAPERVPVLVAILRRIVLDNFINRLSAHERDDKAARLYSFILSRTCDDLFDTLLRLGRELTELDTAEAKSHQQTFAKRAKLIRGVLDVREQFVAVVADIVGGGQ